MQKKLVKKRKRKNNIVICTKHLLIGNKICVMCKEGKRKAKGGF